MYDTIIYNQITSYCVHTNLKETFKLQVYIKTSRLALLQMNSEHIIFFCLHINNNVF